MRLAHACHPAANARRGNACAYNRRSCSPRPAIQWTYSLTMSSRKWDDPHRVITRATRAPSGLGDWQNPAASTIDLTRCCARSANSQATSEPNDSARCERLLFPICPADRARPLVIVERPAALARIAGRDQPPLFREERCDRPQRVQSPCTRADTAAWRLRPIGGAP